MKRLSNLLSRFRRDERGVFAVLFAVMAIVLIATSGAVVDFTNMQQARTRAQTALDAAALALQSQISTQTNDQLKVKAAKILTEQIDDASIVAIVDTVTKDIQAGKLNIQASITVPTAFVQLVGITSISSHLVSEVTRSSSDLEVSVSLDVTGSMAGSKITSLKTATNTLIDLLVQVNQTPTYSKMAIVPWSNGVNVSSTYSNAIRGTPIGGKTVSSITWTANNSKNISGITRANPGVITVNNVTNLANGDWVYISGVSGMTQINGKIGQVANLNTSTKKFRLSINGTNLCTSNTSTCGYYSAYSSGGTVQECLVAYCEEVVTTSSAHGLATDDYAYISGVSGMSSFNNLVWQVRDISTTTYAAVGSTPANGVRTSGGTSYCAQYGCTYQYFTNKSGGAELWQVNNCATERRITDAYNDTAPSTTPVGMSYRQNGAECIPQVMVPLTTDKTALKNLVTTLAANGSTAGQIGLAWGWYMIAPNWAYLWPTASQPAAYGKANLIKAVIFMTDGEFNTVHCNGVISSDTLSSSGVGNSERINCNSDNGLTSKEQAQQFCDAIKVTSNKVLLYTVGFDLAGNNAALTFLRDCATSPDYFYQADTGADLTAAFQAIAQSLSDLRLSK